MSLSQTTFSPELIQDITIKTLDHYVRGTSLPQNYQARHLHDVLRQKKKTFPAAREYVARNVKGGRIYAVEWWDSEDNVAYNNGALSQQARFYHRNAHMGMRITYDELKRGGIHISDMLGGGKDPQSYSPGARSQLLEVITPILQDKLDSMWEEWYEGLARAYWEDGTADPKSIIGVTGLVSTTPTLGTMGGISRVTYDWWRNLAPPPVTSTIANAAENNLIDQMERTQRDIIRFGGKTTHIFCGSDFEDAYKRELRAKGEYTNVGFAGKMDGGFGDIAFKRIPVMYEPILDTLGLSRHAYMLDLDNSIQLWQMANEGDKVHAPARPPERYEIYAAVTTNEALACWKPNSCAIIRIA